MLGSCFLHANKSLLIVRVIVGKKRKVAKKVRKFYNDSTIDATLLHTAPTTRKKTNI
jgi:hypothetical protein